MILSSTISLLNNAALLLALCLVYDMLGPTLLEKKVVSHQILTGGLLGIIGLAIMLNPWNFGHGVVFDTRSVLLVISGFFFGLIPTVVAALITGTFRLVAGGAGIWTGLTVIVASSVIGLLWRQYRATIQLKDISVFELYLLGLVTHVTMLFAMLLLPNSIRLEILSKISLPVLLIYPIATAVLGNFLLLSEKRRQDREASRANERRLRIITDTAKDAIIMMDPDGLISFWNPASTRIFGFTEAEALGKNLHQLIAPSEYRSAHQSTFSSFKRTGQGAAIDKTLELSACHKDGSEIAVELSLSALSLENGWHTVSIVRDNTENKRAEKELRENQTDLKAAQKIAKLGNWTLNTETGQVTWSEEIFKMYGLEPEVPVPKYSDLEAFFTTESWEHLSASLQKLKETGIPSDIELEIRRVDGSRGWIWMHGIASMNAEKKCTSICGVVQDITERKHSEEALKESEARFKALHSASFAGIAIHENGVILDCNQGLSEITGYSVEELIGMNGLTRISESTRAEVIQKMREGSEKPYEAIGLRRDDTEYPIRLEGRNIPYQGRIVRVIEFRDITEQKAHEEEKRQLENKLRQSTKMEAVGQLAGGVAHDFNNMLGVILGYVELLLTKTDPSQPNYPELCEIQLAAQRSADLTRQLLTFARKQTVIPEILDLNHSVAGMLKMLTRLIGENIELLWRPGTELWFINMDPSQIDQILVNLCVNARDAIQGSGKLLVETTNVTLEGDYCEAHVGSVPGEYVRLVVSDTGIGMDKETVSRIFEPFFTTKALGAGTGLGLATAYGAVTQNNGFINVESELGQGTTITIYLPRHSSATSEPPQESPALMARCGSEVILLVEDELLLLQMNTQMLELMGYTVLGASHPKEALRIAASYAGQIQLLITDVLMPEMNGQQLATQLLESRPEIRCLFMSGYTADIIANHGVINAGLRFIQKPFTYNEFSLKIREAIETHS